MSGKRMATSLGIVFLLVLSCMVSIVGMNAVSATKDLELESTPVTTAIAWEPYSYQAVASRSVSWSLTTSIVGINISHSGYIYGIFTEKGKASISLMARDISGTTVYQNFTITILVNPLGNPVTSFVEAADGHLGNPGNPNGSAQISMVNSVISQKLKTVFDLGDLVNGNGLTGVGATIANYSTIKDIYNASGLTYYLIDGNHDNFSAFDSVFPSFSDYYVIQGSIIWILLNNGVNDAQMDFLNDTLNTHTGYLAFVMTHIGQWLIAWPGGESNNTRFQQIIEKNAYHIGGVLCGHAHTGGTTFLDGVYHTYAGTYGSLNNVGHMAYGPSNYNVTGYALGYTVFGVFQNSTDQSNYTIKAWYQSIASNSAVQSTYIEYNISMPMDQIPTYDQNGPILLILASALILSATIGIYMIQIRKKEK